MMALIFMQKWYISLTGKASVPKTDVTVKGFIGSSPICTVICLHGRDGLRSLIGTQVGSKGLAGSNPAVSAMLDSDQLM